MLAVERGRALAVADGEGDVVQRHRLSPRGWSVPSRSRGASRSDGGGAAGSLVESAVRRVGPGDPGC